MPTTTSRTVQQILLLSLAYILVLGGKCGAAAKTTSEFECLTTPNGIPRKIIVKKQDVVAYENPDFTGSSKPVKFFRKYFVFKESGQGFLVGDATRRASTIGWIKQEDCVPWDNQQAIFFINKKTAGRMPVRIWREKDNIDKTEKAHFEESLSRDFTTEPFPILQRDEPFIEVAFLWDAPEGAIPSLGQDLASAGGDQQKADLLQGKRIDQGTEGKQLPRGQQEAQQIIEQTKRMDLVLVIDITGSMGSYMSQVRSRLIEIVDALEKLTREGPQVTINVGIVAYRDYADGQVTHPLALTADMSKVRAFLSSSEFTPSGGAGINEAVCDALYEACQMAWGDRALRVVCLVGDAPPHTNDDEDTRELQATGRKPSSDFFGKSRDENAVRVKGEMDKQRIVFYPISVAGYAETETAFRQLANDPSRFLNLGDATSFITSLEKELREEREVHDAALKRLEDVDAGRITLSDLKDAELEYFKLIGVDPATLAEMRKELIQTGWFRPNVGKDVTIAVYLQRRRLEDWAEELRLQLEAFREKMPNVFEGIMSMSTGDEVKGKNINELNQMSKDLPFKPTLVDPKYRIGMPEEAMAHNLRRKLNNIMILLNNEKLFSDYEEGWVPMDYLPGAM